MEPQQGCQDQQGLRVRSQPHENCGHESSYSNVGMRRPQLMLLNSSSLCYCGKTEKAHTHHVCSVGYLSGFGHGVRNWKASRTWADTAEVSA